LLRTPLSGARKGDVYFDESHVRSKLAWDDLIAAMESSLAAFSRGETLQPLRTVLTVNEGKRFFGIMPAVAGDVMGLKAVTFYPNNQELGIPTHNGTILLFRTDTGEPLAAMDGARLTQWRTAAASALAARYLAKSNARRLLMVGAGAMAPFLVRAHCAVRPIAEVALWNHRRAGAERLAQILAGGGLRITIADDLEQAAREADVISCATLSPSPLIKGDWLKGGQHVDLVGAFNLQMREADDEALRRARVFIDTEAALHEGGDVAVAIAKGAIAKSHIVADLAALCAGATGRRSEDEITLFKSVGAAIEDLAAAMLVWRRRLS
ncbi:MAG TPA: ornithine cyclodeaminase family protein, partial [Roseiarcus sp.]|nr:ornithine cyclodeaminase family protein [Roseiarcus sp.]